MGKDDIYSSRYGVRRCWCGRPGCNRWNVGDFVQGTIEASLTKRQAEAVSFLLNSMDGHDAAAITVTTAAGTKTTTLSE